MNQEQFTLGRWIRTPIGVCLLLSAALATVYLGVAHTAHVLGVAPYLLILLCPILHLFMHGQHSAGGGHVHQEADSPVSYRKIEGHH